MDYRIMNMLLRLPGILIALIAVSFGEALMAHLMGDDTPKNTGRLTISPSAHIDPIGFFMMFFIGFGWGKPMQVNENNFKNRKVGRALFFLSGTIMNLIVAIIFNWIVIFLEILNVEIMELYMVLSAIIGVNLSLGAFRLLPIPQLAGFYFLLEILPYNMSIKLSQLERYSLPIFLILVYTGFISILVQPIINLFLFILKIFTFGF